MRAIWTGALSFGLVNIPVRLYSASAGTELDLHMLHKPDMGPIRFARICTLDDQEIPYDEIVKGYEYQKGDYIVVTDEDFQKASPEKTRAIEIDSFADQEEIDPVYYERPYYLEPDKGADKPYALLREALHRSKKVAIARFVLRNREHLAAVKPEDGVLTLIQMRFASEVRAAEGLQLPDASATSDREITMALALIDQLSAEFQPEQYRDTYTDELKQLIEQKVEGKEPVAVAAAPAPTQVRDLMAQLKASLEQAKKSA
jgi:DNA end-binding protein Ku